MALYRGNFRASTGHIDVVGPSTNGATQTILDKIHLMQIVP